MDPNKLYVVKYIIICFKAIVVDLLKIQHFYRSARARKKLKFLTSESN